jgi:hypothetical protein
MKASKREKMKVAKILDGKKPIPERERERR